MGKSVGTTYNLLKIQEEEGGVGRKDPGNTGQVVLVASVIGKFASELTFQRNEGPIPTTSVDVQT